MKTNIFCKGQGQENEAGSWELRLLVSAIFRKYMHSTCKVLSQKRVQEKGVKYEQNTMIHIHEDAIMKFIILYSAFKI